MRPHPSGSAIAMSARCVRAIPSRERSMTAPSPRWRSAELGSCGQSAVLLARDRLLGNLVAIKLLHQEHEDERTLVDEGAVLGQLRHPSIVRVHGWGRAPNRRLYLVLEY